MTTRLLDETAAPGGRGPAIAEWHLITCEYPPQFGGVSDYCKLVAEGLAASGDSVHVWCPEVSQEPRVEGGVLVHPDMGTLSARDLRRIDIALEDFPGPRYMFVQWVPHGYGYRSMNLGFCLWIWRRARRHGDAVHLMVHEPFLPFNIAAWKQSAAAAIHRIMMMILLGAAQRVSVSTPAWAKRIRKYALGHAIPTDWLPVPSNVPVAVRAESLRMRNRYASDGDVLAGYFGTFVEYMSGMLEALIIAFQTNPRLHFLLIGPGGVPLAQRLAESNPELASRVHATGRMPAAEAAAYIGACDFMVQPYQDGVTSRRTTLMAALANGKPVVTEDGVHSEDLWRSTEAVSLAKPGNVESYRQLISRFVDDPDLRQRAGEAARLLYLERFSVDHVVKSLMGMRTREA